MALGAESGLGHDQPMTVWHIHLLNARNALTPILADLRAAAREAVARVEALAVLPRFDLVIRAERGGGIPDWGVGGCAAHPGLIEVTLDPARFDPALLTRTLVHEMHHLIRWEGPGYGRSLGEALVSEGLAGHFVAELLGGPPDPWDRVAPTEVVLKRAGAEWGRVDYDHAEWFFGRGKLRKWSGYGLGHRIIAGHLAAHPGEDALSLARAPAERFRTGLRRLTGEEEGAEAPDEAPGDA